MERLRTDRRGACAEAGETSLERFHDMTTRTAGWIVCFFLVIGVCPALGQLPGGDPDPNRPGATSRLGRQPGGNARSPLEAVDPQETLVPTGPSPSNPRVPSSISRPGAGIQMPEPLPIPSAAGLPRFEVPMYGRLTFPGPAQDEGPTNGLTLDAAIEVLVRQNLNLRAQAMEIPMARADVLTANLRSNPILFVDSQLIPYGTYTAARPGGQTQYDLNINYPLDITRKRQARTRVACAAERVIEAQYQDAVRLAIDALYAVYVDVLAARETIRLAQASVDGLQNVRRLTQEQQSRGAKTMADVRKVDVQLQTAELGLAQAQAGMTDARRNFAILLGRTGNDPIEVRGMLRDVSMTPEPPDRLVSLALASRPDLAAYRLGIRRAHEEVGLAKANRMSDVYLLYQPYTFQDNAPIGLKSAHSWAVGLTIPLPVYNRNQGNIQRAHWNAAQAQLEVAELERRVQGEVERAYQAYAVTSSAVVRYEGELLPAASEALENALRLYRLGEEGQFVVLDAQREYNTVVRDYLEALIRRRRSMLELNTAVGQRILP